jgi:hypothetical protein
MIEVLGQVLGSVILLSFLGITMYMCIEFGKMIPSDEGNDVRTPLDELDHDCFFTDEEKELMRLPDQDFFEQANRMGYSIMPLQCCGIHPRCQGPGPCKICSIRLSIKSLGQTKEKVEERRRRQQSPQKKKKNY